MLPAKAISLIHAPCHNEERQKAGSEQQGQKEVSNGDEETSGRWNMGSVVASIVPVNDDQYISCIYI